MKKNANSYSQAKINFAMQTLVSGSCMYMNSTTLKSNNLKDLFCPTNQYIYIDLSEYYRIAMMKMKKLIHI